MEGLALDDHVENEHAPPATPIDVNSSPGQACFLGDESSLVEAFDVSLARTFVHRNLEQAFPFRCQTR